MESWVGLRCTAWHSVKQRAWSPELPACNSLYLGGVGAWQAGVEPGLSGTGPWLAGAGPRIGEVGSELAGAGPWQAGEGSYKAGAGLGQGREGLRDGESLG